MCKFFLEVHKLKKSTRILAILMAFAMLIGSFSVMGSAYQAYRDNAVNYNDIDAATFTTEQYASMGLDEVDRMLSEEQLNLYIYIGSLDLTSIDAAVASVEDLLSQVQSLLGMLGDAASLNISSLEGKRRSNAPKDGVDPDLEIVYSVFDFLSDNAGILRNYANGSFNLGILNGFVAEYVFNVKELLTGLLFGLTKAGDDMDYDYFDAREDYGAGANIPTKYLDANNGALTLLQDLLNEVVLGNWGMLDEYLANPCDETLPGKEFYAFTDANGNDVSDQPIDTNAYDYYGWIHPDTWVTVGLGGAKRVANNAAAPAPDYELMDITGNVMGYDFIEALLQRAFNYVLVPVLNRDTAPWLLEECGFTFDKTYSQKKLYVDGEWIDNPDYDPDYRGEAPEGIESSKLYQLFNTDNLEITKMYIPAGETLISNLNSLLGQFVGMVLKTEEWDETPEGYYWYWDYEGGNSVLFNNICTVAKYVLAITKGEFFGNNVEVKDSDEVFNMNNQQVVSYVLRSILNASVDWMYIDDSYQSVAEVGYAACEQLAWQDIPQITYTMPSRSNYADDNAYYDALVEKALTILLDVAAYKLNQELDVNEASGNNPLTQAGLLPYQGDNGSYENNVLIVAEWAIHTYAPALALNLNLSSTGSHTINQFWQDLDTILNSILPLKGTDSIIAASVANRNLVAKGLIFENIVKPVCYLNATNFAAIFDKNPNGSFATKNGIQIIMMILNKVFDLLFPNVFSKTTDTIDGLLVNTLLGDMIYDLAHSLGRKPYNSVVNSTATAQVALSSRCRGLVYVALPIVCQVLGLSDDQEFGELESYMPKIIGSSSVTFDIYNGTSGINTAYTNTSGTLVRDNTYTYKIDETKSFAQGIKNGVASDRTMNITGYDNATQKTIGGGSSAQVTISGCTTGEVVVCNIVYDVLDESGNRMTSASLTNTNYSFVGSVDKDDDEIEYSETIGNRTLKYEKEIYIASGDKLSKINSYAIRLEDSKENKDVENPGTTGTFAVSSVSTSGSYPFAAKNTVAKDTSSNLKGQGGTYFVYPFQVAMNGDKEFVRIQPEYQKDENGKYILDEDGNKIPDGDNGGVPTGVYELDTTLTIAGTTKTVTTRVHIYNDYDLESKFEKAVAANRQSSNYDQYKNSGEAVELWSDYTTALKNAATIALMPKNGNSFESDIAYSGDAENKYELYSKAIDDAIEALEPYALSAGTSAIESALNNYSGFNYVINTDENGYQYKTELAFDDPDYIYFGVGDFVPHTYNRYKAARNNAQDLVNSQKAFISAPLPEDYTDKQHEQYDLECAVVDAFEKPVISAIDSEYAIHMVNLMGERLIRIPANTSKLQIMYDLIAADMEENADKTYTADSYADYQRALDFADVVLSEDIDTLRPTKVNRAHNELVEAWKDLTEACDYRALNAAISQASAIYTQQGAPEDQDLYTAESYAAFYNAYLAATAIETGLGQNGDNQAKIDAAAAALNAAFLGLVVDEGGDDPGDGTVTTYELNTEPLFNSVSWDYAFSPVTDEDLDGNYPTDDGSEYLCGFGDGEAMDPDMIIDRAFTNLQNVEINVVSYDGYYYSTGSKIVISDATKGETLKVYTIILRGDVNCDGEVTLSDATLAEAASCSMWLDDYNEDIGSEWEWSGYGFKSAASDFDGDGTYNLNDAMYISSYTMGGCDLDQMTGEIIAK